jgi:translocation and assembly module TamB
MRRAAKWLGGILAGLALLLLFLVVFANTPPGRRALAWLVPRVTGDTVRLAGLSGRFPDALRVARLELRDAQGAYATVDDVVLDWSPLQLLHGRVLVYRLDAAHLTALRMPVSSSQSSGASMPIEVHEVRFARVDLEAAVMGTPAALALDGSGALASSSDFSGTINVRQIDGLGSYSVSGAADARQLRATLHVQEPTGGWLARLAGLPDLGPLAIDAKLGGPRNAVAAQLSVTAGELHAKAEGSVDLDHEAVDLTVSAGAPAMQPRPDVGWQDVSLEAHVSGPFARPDASAHLLIDRLAAEGASIRRTAADITGNAGSVRLTGELAGLRLPGPDPDLLAAEPLTVEADAGLDQPNRPVHLVLRHRLFTAEADALTGNRRVLDVVLKLPELAPLAARAQTPLEGTLTANLHAAMQGDKTTLAADGIIGVTGGQPQAQALVGEQAHFNLAADVQGKDINVSRLQFAGQDASLEGSGRLAANQLDFTWSLAVSDLAAAEPRLGGELRATGAITGAIDSLNLTADIGGSVAAHGMSSGALSAHIEAIGLPNRPSGTITARGDLLDAPVDLAVSLRQADGGLAINIERANWKSLQASGALQLPAATMVPTGDLRLEMTRLADLAPLVGRPVAGSIRASVSAPAGGPQSAVDARIDAEDLAVSGLRGSANISASGTIEALEVKLTAALPDLHGAPLRLSAAGTVNAKGEALTLASLLVEWQQQTVRLLAPARFGFAEGVTIGNLRLGMQQAVLEVSGRAGSTLDLTASLRNLSADFVGADGTVRADARITGTPGRPTGTANLSATGIRLRSGVGWSMPLATLTIRAELLGTAARIDAHGALGGSRLAVTGTAPLGAVGSLNLRATGSLDLTLLEPILAAGGQRVRGMVSLDATIGGTLAAPQVAGSARLTGGEVQDFASGLHLSDIAGLVEGNGSSLRITRFSAKAGDGTITSSGTIGVTAPGLPVDLTIHAQNAKPLASDLITAVADASLTVRGEALGQLAVSGNVHVGRADIRIPERIPPSIAVLPLRRPGDKPPTQAAAPSTIALSITLEAPSQVYVRGRGIDVEFGGTMKVGGTATAPRTVGALELKRGSISLAGHTLDFSEGQISFNGGSVADPALHLVATSSSANVVATLTVGGTASQPKITLSSVPELPQDEVLAHLLFGSGTGRLGALEIASIASSLATLTGAGGIGDPLDKVRQGLGLDRLTVTSSANGSPALEAGRYIAPRVYVGARQKASGGSQATVQFDITKRLKLEATAGTGGGSATGTNGESNGSGVGLTYQFEY